MGEPLFVPWGRCSVPEQPLLLYMICRCLLARNDLHVKLTELREIKLDRMVNV